MPEQIKHFVGVHTKTNKLDLSAEQASDMSNLIPDINGDLSTRPGYEKDNTSAYSDGIFGVFHYKLSYGSGYKKIYIDALGNVNAV